VVAVLRSRFSRLELGKQTGARPYCRRKSNLKEELRPLEAPGEPWLIKSNDTIRLAPRAKQMVVGRLELPKNQENPQLVCVEPAILPFEGILVARGFTGLFKIVTRPEQPRELAALAVKDAQPSSDRAKSLVHVMVVNFTY
jgi:hypothetical protein